MRRGGEPCFDRSAVLDWGGPRCCQLFENDIFNSWDQNGDGFLSPGEQRDG